ncbi:MAG: chromosomal replication initiator protein DnaA [Syntrophobacteraceae bacterium]|nr:chromosomal replication initiator protein DnaA [Syntrophobacteraceae bacterium]
MDQIWQEIKRRLQKCLSKGQYDLWVSSIEFMGLEGETASLGCKNRFHIEWIREKLEARLLTTVREHFPLVRRLEYEIFSAAPAPEESEAEVLAAEAPRQIVMSDLIKRSGPVFNPRFTFDQFVVGTSNQLAFATAKGLACGQQLYNNSAYILSRTGLGKSHLSHAVGSYLRREAPEVRVHYVTAEQFANEMIYSLKNGKIDDFKAKFRTGCDVLLFEKVEFLSGKEKVQDELVYTLDELMYRGKRILYTGNAFPKDIPKLTNELQSRLGGILAAPIDPPDFTTRIEIIRKKALSENARLPGEVLDFLAERVTGDIRQLESCLIGIIAKSNIQGVPVTLDLARQLTETMLDRLPKLTIEHIQQIVCAAFNILMEDLRSSKRRKELSAARKVGMYLCRRYTTESLESIGKSFRRSHSSVLYAINDLTRLMEKDSKVKRQVEHVSHRLDASCLC